MRACAPMEHIAQCLGEVRCREGVRCALSRRHREYSDWFCFFLLKGFLKYHIPGPLHTTPADTSAWVPRAVSACSCAVYRVRPCVGPTFVVVLISLSIYLMCCSVGH